MITLYAIEVFPDPLFKTRCTSGKLGCAPEKNDYRICPDSLAVKEAKTLGYCADLFYPAASRNADNVSISLFDPVVCHVITH